MGQNDLPFEYTVDRIPSLIFYPSERKSSSVLFPPKEMVSEINLLKFIIDNSSPNVRRIISSIGCNEKCLQDNIFSISSHIKQLNRRIMITRYNINDISGHILWDSKKSTKGKKNLKILNMLKSNLTRLKNELHSDSVFLSNLIRKRNEKPESLLQDPALSKTVQKLLPCCKKEGSVMMVTSRTKKSFKKLKEEL